MLDSKTMFTVSELWLDELSRAYLRFLRDEHEILMTHLRSLTGSSFYIADGAIYGYGGEVKMRPAYPPVKLPDQLQDMFQAWKAKKLSHKAEWIKVQQVVRTILGRCKDWQDVRDMFPDHVLRSIPVRGLMDYQRHRPNLSTDFPPEQQSPWDEKLVKLYNQVKSTINLYVSYKLL